MFCFSVWMFVGLSNSNATDARSVPSKFAHHRKASVASVVSGNGLTEDASQARLTLIVKYSEPLFAD